MLPPRFVLVTIALCVTLIAFKQITFAQSTAAPNHVHYKQSADQDKPIINRGNFHQSLSVLS